MRDPRSERVGCKGQRALLLHPAVLSSHLPQPHLPFSGFPTLTPDPTGAVPPSVSGFLDSKPLPTASRVKPAKHSPHPPHTISCGGGRSRQPGTDPVPQSAQG